MWNPFSRRNDDAGIETLPRAGTSTGMLEPKDSAPLVHNRIAQLQQIGSTAVATLTVTELTQEQGVVMLAELLDELEQTGAMHFVLDIQNVQFMDSACLGCLVEALNRMARKGGRIALANTANSVQYLFRMTQLDRVFPICADVMAAITAVERSRTTS
jgi:anti-sigma B factor antagonist